MSTRSATRRARFDPNDPALAGDPYPTYAALREAGQLCRYFPNQWGVTRYADVFSLLRDPRLGSQFPSDWFQFGFGTGKAIAFFERIMVVRDAPEHTAIRGVMARALTPSVVRQMRDHVGDHVDRLLAPAADSGQLELVDDLARPLTTTVICELIGIPDADRPLVAPHVVRLAKSFTGMPAPDERDALHGSVVWLEEYLRALVDDRRGSDAEDFLTPMVRAVDDGTLGEDDLVDNLVFLFFAGSETTRSMLGTGCAALLSHPSELARLREDPSLAPLAVQEFLRYDAPIQSTVRFTRQEVEIGEQTIPAGKLLVLMLGCANHDEDQFPDAGLLDIARRPNPHVAFGGGSHHCLGSVLAGVEGTVVFERLVERFRSLEAAGEAVRGAQASFRTWSSIPVAVRPA